MIIEKVIERKQNKLNEVRADINRLTCYADFETDWIEKEKVLIKVKKLYKKQLSINSDICILSELLARKEFKTKAENLYEDLMAQY